MVVHLWLLRVEKLPAPFHRIIELELLRISDRNSSVFHKIRDQPDAIPQIIQSRWIDYFPMKDQAFRRRPDLRKQRGVVLPQDLSEISVGKR